MLRLSCSRPVTFLVAEQRWMGGLRLDLAMKEFGKEAAGVGCTLSPPEASWPAWPPACRTSLSNGAWSTLSCMNQAS